MGPGRAGSRLPGAPAAPGPTAAFLAAPVPPRPASTVPLASFGVAVSCTVCPVATLAEAGLTETDATGTAVTVAVAVPLLPSLVAVVLPAPPPLPPTPPRATPLPPLPLSLAHALARPPHTLPAPHL